MVRLRPSRKDPGGGAAPIACTSGRDVPVNGPRRARPFQVRKNQREIPLHAVALLRTIRHECARHRPEGIRSCGLR